MINYLLKKVSDLTDENKALKDQLNRCQKEMKLYQDKYPEFQSSNIMADNLELDDDLPPWISQSRLISPLLVAYENRIQNLTQRNLQQQRELNTLRSEAETWIKRNKDMEIEMKKNIQTLVSHIENANNGMVSDASKGGTISKASVPEEIKELHEHIAIYREQLQLYKQQEEDHQNQIVQLVSSVKTYQSQIKELKEKVIKYNELSHIKDSQANQIINLNTELTSMQSDKENLQNNLKSLKIEYKSYIHKYNNFRKKEEQHVKDLKLDVEKLRNELKLYNQREIDLQAKLEHYEKQIEIYEDHIKKYKRDKLTNDSDMQSMVSSLEQLEKTLNSYKAKEDEMLKREDDMAKKIHQSELAKDKALANQSNYIQQIDQLKQQIQIKTNQLEKESKEKMLKLYTKSKNTEEVLANQLKSLQLVCAELDVQKDQAERQVKELTLRYELYEKKVMKYIINYMMIIIP